MNQEQNNLNPNNFNTQGNNRMSNNQSLNNMNQSFNNTFNNELQTPEIPQQNVQQTPNVNQPIFNTQPEIAQNHQHQINQMNVQEPTTQPVNSFESGNNSNKSLNIKPPKKINLGLIIGIVAVGAAVIGGTLLFSNMSNNDDKGALGGNSNNENVNVDLTIDESIPKSITCSLVRDAIYTEGTYSYEYVLPNWNRYTFIKEYEPENHWDGNVYRVEDYDKECKENRYSDSAQVYTDDFRLDIHYYVDAYSSAAWSDIKDRATGNVAYTEIAGSPTLYGNDNGYWYAYMDTMYNLKTHEDEGYDVLFVKIWKEINNLENAHTTLYNANIVGDERHALVMYIKFGYENEVGKVKLNYLLNDLKEILTEKYDLDLSELSVEMFKK